MTPYEPKRRRGVHWPVENTHSELAFDLAHCETCLREREAEIETLRETLAAMEKYIYAIPALCRGEEVACALHVSSPIKELRSEIERLKAGGWQPIETAPKDGTWILVYTPENEEFKGGHSVATWAMNTWIYDGMCPEEWPPTHWMPLPQPPQGETT